MSDESSPVNEEVIIRQEEAQLVLPITRLYAPFLRDGNLLCSVDPSSAEGFQTFMALRHGETEQIADHINQTLDIVNFLILPIRTVQEETGEVVLYPRTCLELSDGRIVSAGSKGVFGSLSDMLRFRPHLPWSPPFTMKVVAKSIGKGHRYFVLLPVFDPVAGHDKRKEKPNAK